MNIFNLAIKQLQVEGVQVTNLNILEYAEKIRHWLDKNPKMSKAILEGRETKTRQEKYYYNTI